MVGTFQVPSSISFYLYPISIPPHKLSAHLVLRLFAKAGARAAGIQHTQIKVLFQPPPAVKVHTDLNNGGSFSQSSGG
jgi:hypothetical protein